MIYLIIIVTLAFLLFIWNSREYVKMFEDTEEMKETFIFKHPCGEVVPSNDYPQLFDRDSAIEYAKTHPYHYVKNCYDNTWSFAYSYFNLNESKTI